MSKKKVEVTTRELTVLTYGDNEVKFWTASNYIQLKLDTGFGVTDFSLSKSSIGSCIVLLLAVQRELAKTRKEEQHA